MFFNGKRVLQFLYRFKTFNNLFQFIDKQAEEALLKKIDQYHEIYEGKESLGKKLLHKAKKKVHQLKSTRSLN